MKSKFFIGFGLVLLVNMYLCGLDASAESFECQGKDYEAKKGDINAFMEALTKFAAATKVFKFLVDRGDVGAMAIERFNKNQNGLWAYILNCQAKAKKIIALFVEDYKKSEKKEFSSDEDEVIRILYTLIDTYKTALKSQNTKNMQELIKAVDKIDRVETN